MRLYGLPARWDPGASPADWTLFHHREEAAERPLVDRAPIRSCNPTVFKTELSGSPRPSGDLRPMSLTVQTCFGGS